MELPEIRVDLTQKLFVELIIPLAAGGSYTYQVPEHLKQQISIGIRVEVNFGPKKHYAAIVKSISNTCSIPRVKEILSILDDKPIISSQTIAFWNWIADYYACSLGEVMAAALPSFLKLDSETKVQLQEFEHELPELTDDEYLIYEALQIKPELSLREIQLILNKQTILPIIKQLISKHLIHVREELKTQKEIVRINYIRLSPEYVNQAERIDQLFKSIEKSELQTRCVLAYLQHHSQGEWTPASQIIKHSGVGSSVISALVKKNIFQSELRDKYGITEDPYEQKYKLSDEQQLCLQQIEQFFTEHKPVLLQGVTGSGKTLLYIELALKRLKTGAQVLYLVPEISITTQLISRIQQFLGKKIYPYHSDINNAQKASIWQAVSKGESIFIIGARSALFLPFTNLQLIIVDEEHDGSLKQQDTNPRYQARDASIFLSNLYNGNVLLGSATPSLESYYNTQINKYGLVRLQHKYYNVQESQVLIVDLKKAYKHKEIQSIFTKDVIKTIDLTLQQKKQILIFRNKRGFAPIIECGLCTWKAMCLRCDIHLTYHKFSNSMLCHLCGAIHSLPKRCPECNNTSIRVQGFGTEKIEEELAVLFPNAVITRMDLDTARGKKQYEQIISKIEHRETDIIVGTQMVTKGLDFEHLDLVVVPAADHMLNLPDFRANERSFQLLTQVAGRAGRKHNPGRVIIQTFQPENIIFTDVIDNNYERFVQRELSERQKFNYPPFSRLIYVTLKHVNETTVEHAAQEFANRLKTVFPQYVLGPAIPHISRINNQYIRLIHLKMPKQREIAKSIKRQLIDLKSELIVRKGMGSLRITVDIDPN